MKGFALAFLFFVVVTLVFRYMGRSMEALASTYKGRWQDYRGPKTLLVALYIPGASVWRATAGALESIDRSRYDLQVIDVGDYPAAMKELGVSIVPTVVVVRDGNVVDRFPNLTHADTLAGV